MPEPFAVTLALVIASGAAAIYRGTSSAVEEAYDTLKNFLSKHYKRVNTSQIESEPASQEHQKVLTKELSKAGVEHDSELRKLAADLVARLGFDGTQASHWVGVDPGDLSNLVQTIVPPRGPIEVLSPAAIARSSPPETREVPQPTPGGASSDGPVDFTSSSTGAGGSGEAAKPPETREITVTGHALNGDAVSQFKDGEMYQLRFRVGPPVSENLAFGNVGVEDVPKGGLQTHWVVCSKDDEFVPSLSTAQVQKIGSTWIAEFDLLIPEAGTSITETIGLVGRAQLGDLLLTIYAISAGNSREVYREVSVSLVGSPQVKSDETCKAPNHTHLSESHEWTTPAEHIQISVLPNLASVTTKRIKLQDYEFFEPWVATDNLISGAIQNVRDSLEAFREAQEPYLNDLESADISARLKQWTQKLYFERSNGWQPLPMDADPPHNIAFNKVQATDEWRVLASDGYQLFDRCFPQGTRLRTLLQNLLPGSRIDFHWSNQSGPGWVSHVPWALMYMEPVDVTGQTLPDPEKFLGLRFRIGTRSWTVNDGSVVLGGLDKTHSMNLLYWGDKQGDDVAVESKWQAAEYAKWTQSKLLPDATLPDLKKQIVLALNAPGPAPISVLYFYCHCSVGAGEKPVLRFGNTSKAEDILNRTDLPQTSIPDGPLVFANACTTSQADPHMTSELEQSFFQRGVRGFIGAETKVPIQFASRFAWIYFQFLYRTVAPEPVSAGEALTQTRMFLWTQYQNIGGLFYSMTNQYDLYVASEAEVLNMRP